MTHTYATVPVRRSTFEEVYGILSKAGYAYALHDGVIDMHGLGLVVSNSPEPDPKESLKKILGYIEDGTLVRSTDKDAYPGWAIRILRFVRDLAEAQKVATT